MEFLLILQKRWSLILSIVGTLQNEVKSCNLGRVWIPYHQRQEHNRQRLQTFARPKKTYSKWTFGKSSGWIEPETPRSPVQHSNH